jgi:hypothetical protein
VLKRGTHEEHSRKGTQNGTQIGYTKKRCLKRVLKKGCSKIGNSNKRVIHENSLEKLLRVRAAVIAGHWRAVTGSVVYNGAMAREVWQHIGYLPRTQTTGALIGGSGWRLLCTTHEHARVCTGTARGLRHGTHTVLKW